MRRFINCIFLCIAFSCNHTDKKVPNRNNNEKSDDTIVSPSLYFETHTINLDSLNKIVLIQYVKNSKFDKKLRSDTFEITPLFYRNTWGIYMYKPYGDSIRNVYNYDYEIEFINSPKIKIRYSDIIIKRKKVYHGHYFYIDSFTYNGMHVKNNFAANSLGFW
jgi:hypothetical protein